jgi:triacylglycerol lipase
MTFPPRPLPEETIQNLIPPLVGYPYFAQADQLPFHADATEYSANNAWWMAEASFLVYGYAEFIETVFAASPLRAMGYELDWLGSREQNRGFVLRDEQAMIVVFRGTRLASRSLFDVAEVVLIDQDDLRTDSRFVPNACRAGGHVHSGFLEAYAAVSDRLDEILARQRTARQRIWLTGHSLGGALASLAAAHLPVGQVQGLYTFGSPRVGDAAFADVLSRTSHFRFVHRNDWVPRVPPEWLGYAHAGTLMTLDESGRRSLWNDLAWSADRLASVVQVLKNRQRFQMNDLPFQVPGLADHAPIYYATLLWNRLVTT